MKKIVSKKMLALLLIIFAIMPATAMANETLTTNIDAQQQGISPRLTYIVDSFAGLSINNNVATVDCWVEGHYGEATKAKVIAELQVKSGNSWIAYGTWTDTQYDYDAAVDETKTVKSGNTYRVKATVTVWEGSQSEQLILFTDEVTA